MYLFFFFSFSFWQSHPQVVRIKLALLDSSQTSANPPHCKAIPLHILQTILFGFPLFVGNASSLSLVIWISLCSVKICFEKLFTLQTLSLLSPAFALLPFIMPLKIEPNQINGSFLLFFCYDFFIFRADSFGIYVAEFERNFMSNREGAMFEMKMCVCVFLLKVIGIW